MVKIPGTVRRYCPYCKTHTEHKVKHQKTGARKSGGMTKGERRIRTIMEKGYGGSPRPIQANSSRYGAKVSKKVVLKYTCTKCGKSHQTVLGRAKKIEVVTK